MNRRSFLEAFLKGAVAAAVAPQIVTHGLNLKRLESGLYVHEPCIYTYVYKWKYNGENLMCINMDTEVIVGEWKLEGAILAHDL